MIIDFQSLNTLDWFVIVLMVWSVANGVWVGFSNEVFGFIGLVAAFIITAVLGHMLDGPLAGILPDNAVGRMISRAVVFMLCILVIHLIASSLATTLKNTISAPVDHTLGVFFGFFRGLLIILLPFLLVNLYVDPKVYPEWLVEAQTYPFLTKGAHLLRRIIPNSEIDDHDRTDFGALEKAKHHAEEQEERLTHMGGKVEKDER